MELAQIERVSIMLDNLFFVIPENLDEALKKAQWFLNGGQKIEDKKEDRRLYSFSHDANFIFAAFKNTHDIDLQKETSLHWWKFLSLFMDLGQETTFCNLIGLRSRYYAGKCTDDEKESINKMGSIFKVPENDIKSLQELEASREFLENHKKAVEKRRLARAT